MSEDHSPDNSIHVHADTEGKTLLGADQKELKNQRVNICLLLVAVIICMSSFQFGYHIGVINTPENVIRKCGIYNETEAIHYPLIANNTDFFKPCIPMSDVQWAAAVSIFTIGGLFGGLSGGKISDLLGRRLFLWSNNWIFIAGSLLLSLATNFYVIAFGRLVLGVASGFVTVGVPVYLSEISPQAVRGTIGSMNQFLVTVGILVAQLLAIPAAKLEFFNAQLWRPLMSGGAVLAILQIILLPFCPQSPVYLANRNENDKALKALATLRRTDDVDDELQAIQAINNKNSKSTASFKDLFRRSMIRPLVIGAGLQLAQQFSGINVVMSFSNSIFVAAQVENSDIATAVVGAVNVAATVLSFFLVDRLGRRTLLIAAQIGELIFFSILAVAFILIKYNIAVTAMGYVGVASTLLYIVNFAYGMGPIPWILIGEIFPSDVKGYASSIAVGINWLSNFTVVFTFIPLSSLLQAYVFLPYVVAIFIGLMFTIIVVPETKGKSLDEL